MASRLCPTRSHFAGLLAHVDHSLSKEGGGGEGGGPNEKESDLPMVSSAERMGKP